MVKFFKTENGVVIEIPEFQKKCWIDLVNPTDDEVEDVAVISNISDEMLKAALDEEESARYDIEDDNKMFIVDVPVIEEGNAVDDFSTMPMSVIFNDSCVCTVSLKENAILKAMSTNRIRSIDATKPEKFLLTVLYRNSKKFLQFLKQIDKTSLRVQAELQRSMKNKELIELLGLENSLVYFSTSLASNQRLYDKMEKNGHFFVGEDNDLFDDVIVESKQAIEMCTIYRDILSGTMDAFASVISNNVNVVMKLLTIITVIISIPTLIASLWGMNVSVPFEDTTWGFWILIGLAIVITAVVAVVLFKMTDKIRIKKAKKRRLDD